jgi:hypothetical protein
MKRGLRRGITYPRSPTNVPNEFVVSEVNSNMERARGPNQKNTVRLKQDRTCLCGAWRCSMGSLLMHCQCMYNDSMTFTVNGPNVSGIMKRNNVRLFFCADKTYCKIIIQTYCHGSYKILKYFKSAKLGL